VTNVPLALKSFWTCPMELLGDVGHVESHFGPLEIVFVSVQDRSIICAKRTIASEIILHAPDGTHR
jgi:rRNA processing protein Gar1